MLRIAKKWIAGTKIEDAIKDAKKANSRGIGAVLNYLGEDIRDNELAEKHTEEYLRLQNEIENNGIKGSVSLKLTQIGIILDTEKPRKRLERIVENGRNLKQYVWIDMESSKFTDATLSLYLDMLNLYSKVGLALQAYMKRTAADLEKVIEKGGSVRLVKGAYKESSDIVFSKRNEIRKNYKILMERLFKSGVYFAIATHDKLLIDRALEISDGRKGGFEFEFLKGIRDELKNELVSKGYTVSEYIPYGDDWYPYSMRRMSEHPSNIILLLRSLV